MHPPGPSGAKLFGSLMEIRRDRIRFVTEAARDYGDVVSFRMGPRRIYLLRHPDHVRHVLIDNRANYEKGLGLKHAADLLGHGLLTSEGVVWERQRKEMAPVLSREENVSALADCVRTMVERRARSWRPGQPIDFAREMVLLGIEITGKALLGCDLADIASQIADDLEAIGSDAMRRMTAALPGPWQRLSWRARSALRRMDRIVEARLSRSVAEGDSCFPGLLAGCIGRRELRDQLLTMLLAGHETTASTLSWTLHLLAEHPSWQVRLRDEIRAVAGRAPIGAEHVPQLRLMAMVLHESMRLYPAVWMLPRRNTATDVIGSYEIPPDSDVLLSVYTMHRHPSFWRDPDAFQPDRFATQAGHRAFMPFGVGPRACVGRRLGVVESTIALATLLRKFEFAALPGHRPSPCASLTLHPSPALWLTANRAEIGLAPAPCHDGNGGEVQKLAVG